MQICVSKLFNFLYRKNTELKLSKRDDMRPKAYKVRLRFRVRLILGAGERGEGLFSEFYGN